MKVGTDGVLLGAWAAVRPQDRRMLDIGTGTGLIALMLAQRAPEAHVTGVDIDDVGQARENAAASPWSGRVAFAQCPVQEFETPEPFDLIVSNPPFFVDSLTCPDRGRTAARHAVHLPFGDLRDAVLRLLAPGGRFAVILPTAEAERFLAVCAGRLALVRRTDVRTTPRRPAKRALMEFVRRTRREGRIACMSMNRRCGRVVVAVSPCCRDSLFNSRISAKRRCCAPTALYNSRKRAKYTCCTVT